MELAEMVGVGGKQPRSAMGVNMSPPANCSETQEPQAAFINASALNALVRVHTHTRRCTNTHVVTKGPPRGENAAASSAGAAAHPGLREPRGEVGKGEAWFP